MAAYVSILEEIPTEGAEHRLQEIFKGIQLLVRKYSKSKSSEAAVNYLKKFMKSLSGNDAIASCLWILGEYSHIFENAVDILEFYAKGLVNYERHVQLQLLNCSVKIYLKINQQTDSKHTILNEEKMDEVMTSLLEKVTEFDNPDLRDRAFIYWRLLSLEDNLKEVFEAMSVKGDTVEMDQYSAIEPDLVDHLIQNIALTSSVFHEKPEKLFPTQKEFDKRAKEEETEGERILEGKSPSKAAAEEQKEPASPEKKGTGEVNIIDLDFGPDASAKEQKGATEVEQPKITVKRGIKKLPIGQQLDKEKNPNSGHQEPTEDNGNLLDLDFSSGNSNGKSSNLGQAGGIQDIQLIDLTIGPGLVETKVNGGKREEEEDLFGVGGIGRKTYQPTHSELVVVLSRNTSGRNGQKGLEIRGAIQSKEGESFLVLEIENLSPVVIESVFDVQLKPNYFYLQPEKLKGVSIGLGVNKTIPVRLMKSPKGVSTPPSYPLSLTVGLKTNYDTFFFDVPCVIHSLIVNPFDFPFNSLKQPNAELRNQ